MAAILYALTSYIQNMLTEMGKEEVHMLLGVSKEIDKMGDKLGDLKNFLADADRRNITDLTVKAWVRDLRDAMYDATNILDLCQLKAMEQGPRRDVGCFNPLLFCMRNPLHAHDIGNRIKDLNKRLDEIEERSKVFGFIDLGSYEHRNRRVPSSHLSSRETSAELDESGLVGEKIKEDTRNLVEMLTKEKVRCHEENKIKVFAIVGVGGIGKTTLAKKIFNHDTVQQEFSKKIWLSVNQDFNENEILRRTIMEAGGDHTSLENTTKNALVCTLKKILNGQKTLLVMDDVWNHQTWETVLKNSLVNILGQGSRVLITTRHNMVARGMMAEKPYYHINKLEPEDAWLLLKNQVVDKQNQSDMEHIEMLKDIGMAIIKKCDCLPLAVKVIGGLLLQKRPIRGDWENVLNDSIWSESQMHEELNFAIYLSYDDLHPSLKPCFLHYSLIPKGRVFFADDIVGMWISEGFIHGTSHDLEEKGKEYYIELMQRNLIEPDSSYTDQNVCNMHDIIRSFAQYVARNEALVAQYSGIDISDKLNSQNFIQLSLETAGSEPKELEWCSLQAQRSLRTLISVGNIKIKPGDSLLRFPNLRTLHVTDANFDELAEYLNQLKYLRYLSIERTDTSRLPENIGRMKFLQYISLLGCKSLVKLPSSIVKLQHLRYLNLNDTRINDIPRSFNCLTSLRKLYGFPAYMAGDWCSLEELGPLYHLTKLDVSGLENVSSSSFASRTRLGDKLHLSYLSLKCTSTTGDASPLLEEEAGIFDKEQQQQIEEVFDKLCPPPCLETLGIEGHFGQRLPGWLMSTAVAPLVSLRYVIMNDLPYCLELPDGLCLLPFLELLLIQRAPAIKRVGIGFLQPNHRCHSHSNVRVAFPRLSKLYFDRVVEWKEWEWEEQVEAMPILEELSLKMCKLRLVPPGLTFHARALKKLRVYGVKHLSSLENFCSLEYLDVFESPDMQRISNLPKLEQLVIIKCPKMKVLEAMPALQRLHLLDYDMETVPRYIKDVKPRQFLLGCSLWLLTCIAEGKSGYEWDKFNHIEQVKAYADDDGISRKWYVVYTRAPFHFETNISRSVINQARRRRTELSYMVTCSIEDEWSV